MDRVEPALGELLGDALQRVAPLAPRRLRIVVVHPADVEHLLPELLHCLGRLELGVHELRPLLGRSGSDAPVDGAIVDHLRPLLHARKDVAAESFGVEVVVQVRCDRAAEQDRRAALLAQLQRPLSVPRRHEVEYVVRGVLHAHAFQERVPVVDVDELRAALVRARGERTCELLLAETAPDVEDLTGLDVGAEVDDQVGVALETVLHGKAILSPARMLAHARTGRDRSLSRIPKAR